MSEKITVLLETLLIASSIIIIIAISPLTPEQVTEVRVPAATCTKK